MAAPTILVFDSGLGGLTVFREVVKARPDARYVYVADDAFFPYGRHSEDALVGRVVPLMAELIATHAPDLVVIACNTASTLVLPHLRARFAVPFVGTVPAIKPACGASQIAARVGARHRGDGEARIHPRPDPGFRPGLRRDPGRLRTSRLDRGSRAARQSRSTMPTSPARSRPASSTATAGAPTPSCSPAPIFRCCSIASQRLMPWPVDWIDPGPGDRAPGQRSHRRAARGDAGSGTRDLHLGGASVRRAGAALARFGLRDAMQAAGYADVAVPSAQSRSSLESVQYTGL